MVITIMIWSNTMSVTDSLLLQSHFSTVQNRIPAESTQASAYPLHIHQVMHRLPGHMLFTMKLPHFMGI